MTLARYPAYLSLVRSRPAPTRTREGRREAWTRDECDELTGLATRQALMDRLEMIGSLAPGCPLSFLVVKVSGMHGINAAEGVRAGDDVLRTVAWGIRDLTRATDVVGRLKGASFGIVLQGTGATAAAAVAARMTHHLNQLTARGRPVRAAVSVATGRGINADTLPLAAIDSLGDCG